jgi:beta-glucanase (GH16 family)
MTCRKGTADGRLVWSDEFDEPAGAPPNPSWWSHETGAHGWGNDELQNYTGNTINAKHDGIGNLAISATRTGSGYASARLITKGRFQFCFGRLEARLRVPAGPGLWPALWMLGANIDEVGWPQCGEIDVMEHVGAAPQRVFGTVHCPGHFGKGGLSGTHAGDNALHEGFHVFAVDWKPETISWSIDGATYFSVTADELGVNWVFNHPFYILIDLAVGGTLGGEVDGNTVFPADLTIDYVRVYQRQ